MGEVGQRETLAQRCVVAFFKDALGYAYLGHWKDCADRDDLNRMPLVHEDWRY